MRTPLVGLAVLLAACAPAPSSAPEPPGNEPTGASPEAGDEPGEAGDEPGDPAVDPVDPVDSPGDPVDPPVAAPASPGEETPTSLPPACDQYLALYESCEAKLQPEIDAGDRRTYASEKAGLEYMAGTPEGAGLAEACAAMYDELKASC